MLKYCGGLLLRQKETIQIEITKDMNLLPAVQWVI